ncbi:MAG: hypothetical protein VX589_04235 [Myxococcota bacterium]|nr:hypothetical protein [Myxococcota bacterium]
MSGFPPSSMCCLPVLMPGETPHVQQTDIARQRGGTYDALDAYRVGRLVSQPNDSGRLTERRGRSFAAIAPSAGYRPPVDHHRCGGRASSPRGSPSSSVCHDPTRGHASACLGQGLGGWTPAQAMRDGAYAGLI